MVLVILVEESRDTTVSISNDIFLGLGYPTDRGYIPLVEEQGNNEIMA